MPTLTGKKSDLSSAVPTGRRFLQPLPKVVFGSTAFYIFPCEINPTDATSTSGTQRTREEAIRRHTLHTGHSGAQKLFQVDFFFFFSFKVKETIHEYISHSWLYSICVRGALMCFARARLLADVSKNYFHTALQPWAVDTLGRKWGKKWKNK